MNCTNEKEKGFLCVGKKNGSILENSAESIKGTGGGGIRWVGSIEAWGG